MTKINVWRIVRDHFSTLRNFDTNAVSISDYVVFVGFPFLVSIALWRIGFNFGADVLNALLAAFSIFAGLLLNLLVLICGFAGNERFSGFDAASSTRRRFLREIHQNLSFAILVSIAVVVVALLGLCEIKFLERPGHAVASNPWVTGSLAMLLVNFILTLLMVLKRIHYLLAHEFAGPRANRGDRAA